MKLSDIQQELIRLFDEQDASAGTIVVWHDPDGAFADSLGALDLSGVEVMCEEERELFSLKRTLNGDLAGRRILLYRPRPRRLEGDWLADIEARSTSFAADYASMQLRELNAVDTHEMREALATHKAPLAKKTVLRKLARLSPSYEQPQQLACGLMAIALDAPSLDAQAIVRAYLIAALASDGAEALSKVENMGCADEFRAAMAAWVGFTGDVSDFIALGRHVLLRALAGALPNDAASVLPADITSGSTALCQDIVRGWCQSGERDSLFELAQLVEEVAPVEQMLAQVSLETLGGIDVFPCVDALILRRLFHDIATAPESAAGALVFAQMRHNAAWYREFSICYDGLEAAAHMQRFRNEHPGGIDALSAERVWGLYTGELYRVDTWYRQMHLALGRALISAPYGLDEDFRACSDQIENLYKNWFLAGVSRRWEDAAEDGLTRSGHADGIPRQLDFFMSSVEPIMRAGKRACVIVSDALRYEVAAELAEALEQNTKGTCELASMQATFPSITSCGMASLLPCGNLTMNAGEPGRLHVLLDGSEVDTTAARQEQLRRSDPHAVAITYDSLVNEMSASQRKDLVKDTQVVYVYHNTIDAMGDKAPTERKVFSACDDTVKEIFGLVQLICRERIASQVVVTADHGFLYTDEPLDTSERTVAAEIDGDSIVVGRRYAIAEGGARSDVLMPIALPYAEGGLKGFAPRRCTCIARAGAGENYVHGGVSLQELCVPVLTFTNKRAGSKGYVESEQATLSLITTVDTISNSIFKLDLLQDKPVGGKVLPASYDVFVGNASHEPVTDIAHVAADRTQGSADERVIPITLNIKPGATVSEQEPYFLYARNCDIGTVDTLRELRMRIAFAPSFDFGW